MKQKFIVVSMKYKGTDITYRRWFDGGKEEILIDKNFAKLMGRFCKYQIQNRPLRLLP